MTKSEIRTWLSGLLEAGHFESIELPDDGDPEVTPTESLYIGSFMSLDPCGRYHHILSPNGITKKCERFWTDLEEVAQELGAWIETGEGDPTDIYLARAVRT